MLFQFSIDISVDPSFGFVKALRIAKSCEPKSLVSDSEKMSLHLDFERDAEKVLHCISSIRGLASIDIRLVIIMCVDNPRKVLRSIGMNIVPSALSARILAYAQRGNGVVFVEKTSRRDLFLARYARVKHLSFPVPPSVYVVYGYIPEVIERARESLMVLIEFGKELLSKLRELGVEPTSCEELEKLCNATSV